MGNIFIDFDMGVPQISCTDCIKCDSIIGRSLCNITDRGCCHYFPEFTLVDIQRMAILEGGLNALDMVLSNPGTIINNFNLYSKGLFDKEAHDQYITMEYTMDAGNIKDHTIFFRTCPFVIPGFGCKLPIRFRTTVCNFFICAEILERTDLQDDLKIYMVERSRYARWIYRESGTLQHILDENKLNLISNLSAAIDLLAQINPSCYEFPSLESISYV